jgi:hypothetical protein
MSESVLLRSICEARVRGIVNRVEGFCDEVLVGMIMRHLERCPNEEDADAPGLLRMLSILVVREHAAQLTDAIVPPHVAEDDARRRSRGDAMASRQPDEWPFLETLGPIPARSVALDPAGPYGAAARGVEVRHCVDSPAKGLGVFATRELRAGELVGLYVGEKLTFSEFWARHGAVRRADGSLAHTVPPADEGGCRVAPCESAIAAHDRSIALERLARLGALTPGDGAPCGGWNNQGTYVFRLPPYAQDRVRGKAVYCVDAEDPNQSSFCRYLNHDRGSACNVAARVDAHGAIWFAIVAARVAAGTELCFDYGRGAALDLQTLHRNACGDARAQES